MENYNRMELSELKHIGKEMGLLGVDLNNKKELIKRLNEGKQLSDFDKKDLLERAKNLGVLVNATMSKNTIIQKIQNPRLQNLSDKRLREIAKQRGVRLRGIMPRKDIIQRLETPTAYHTVQDLKRLAKDDNIQVRKGVTKTELLNILGERGIIREREDVKITPLGVEQQIGDLEEIKEIRKRPPTSKRKALQQYKNYIKNIKTEYLSSVRTREKGERGKGRT